MNYKKNVWKQSLALLLVIIMMITSIQYMPSKVSAKTKSEAAKETTYEGEGYEVNFKVTSSWSGAFNASVTVKNTSDTVIDNWAIRFAMPYEITNIWNGVVKSNEDGLYIIKNAGHNQDIAVGKSINFGFSAKCDDKIQLSETFNLLCFETELSEKQVEISCNITGDWS